MTTRPLLLLVAMALTATACASTPAATDGAVVADGAVEGPEQDVAGQEGAAPQDVSGEASVTTDETTDEAAGAPDAAAPEFASLTWTAETTQGEPFDAAGLAGDNVVLWMWAPWCSVCNREAPDVAKALADLPDDVRIIGVAGRDEVGPMRDFIEEHSLQGITHVVDADGSLWARYGVSYQPAWVFIDGEGEASVAAGALGYDGIFAGIDEVFRG